MTKRQAAEAAPAHARCAECGSRKDEHGRLGFSCPAPYRTTFVPSPSDSPFDDPNDLQDVEDEEAWAEAVAEGDARSKLTKEDPKTRRQP